MERFVTIQVIPMCSSSTVILIPKTDDICTYNSVIVTIVFLSPCKTILSTLPPSPPTPHPPLPCPPHL